MITVFGKEVLLSLKEMVNPRTAALLLVDVDNVSWEKDILKNIKQVAAAAREAGVLRIYTTNVWDPHLRNISPPYIAATLHASGRDIPQPFHPEEISERYSTGFHPETQPEEGDLTIEKARASAFVGTNLDQLLRSNQIQSVIVLGRSTDACVSATVTFAMNLDYYVVVLKDCVMGGISGTSLTSAEAAECLWGHWLYTVGWQEVADIWKSSTS